jgi:hypothetical protein
MRLFIRGLGVFCTLALISSLAVTAMAQQAPVRVVQGSDGTLYVVQAGNSWTLIPDQISDSDIAALTPSGEVDGALGGQPTPLRAVQGSDGTLYLVQGSNSWTLVPDQLSDSDLATFNPSGEIDGLLPDRLLVSPPPVQPAAVQPTPPAPSGPAPITGTVDLTGKAGSDTASPTLIAVGSTISSSVDGHLKPQDVFSIELSTGVTYQFFFSSLIQARTGTVWVQLLNPDQSQAKHTNGPVAAPGCAWQNEHDCAFTPIASGTYYLVVNPAAVAAGVRYSFTTVSPSTPRPAPISGTVDLSGKVAFDFPGTLVSVGSTISSAVDDHTKWQDVFSIDLSAGTTYHFLFTSLTQARTGTVWVQLLNPDQSQAKHTNGPVAAPGCAWQNEPDCSFTPVTNGTYYLVVNPAQGATGVRYSVKIQ